MSFTYLLLAVFSLGGAQAHNEKNYDIELFCQDINVILQRVKTTAFNIANQQTTRTIEGGHFKRVLITGCKNGHCTTKVDQTPPMLHYMPDHPDTNENGYVAFPNFSITEEMDKMVKASKAYELIMKEKPINTKDLLVGNKLDQCFENYKYFKERFDFKTYLGR